MKMRRRGAPLHNLDGQLQALQFITLTVTDYLNRLDSKCCESVKI